jgi:hypothetical protein
MSRFRFAQIPCLQANRLDPAEMPGALQANEQLLDGIERDIIACQPRDVMRELVACTVWL